MAPAQLRVAARRKTAIRTRALFAAPLLWLAACAMSAQEPTLAITGATVIDGTGAEPRPGTTILIAGDRIVAVGPDEVIHQAMGWVDVTVDAAAS